jgi:DNA-binding beta-propeller fold protein YncE
VLKKTECVSATRAIIGGVDRNFVNGNFDEARFYNPQGIAFQDDEVVYIADTGNHAVRKVNLKARTVTTLVSSVVPIKIDEKSIRLRSPWDLAFYGNEVLLVAAAGNHRIFAYFFQDLPLFGKDHEANSFSVVAGSGREENRNNTYILKASFAQPSGISCSQGLNENDKIIYIADSESSSIRYIDSGGRVMGLVGGNRDPTDLFAYIDSDGCFLEVKLQHPCSGVGASKIFVADTYNHKIKMIDVESKHSTTLIGTGTAGSQVGSFTRGSPWRRLAPVLAPQLAVDEMRSGLVVIGAEKFGDRGGDSLQFQHHNLPSTR